MDLKKLRCKIDFIFKISYLLLGIFTFNIITTGTGFNKFYTYFVFVFGMAVFFFRVTAFKDYRNTKGLLLLIIFSVLSLLSAIINFRYGGINNLVENAQSLVWMSFSFFNLYAYDASQKKTEIKKDFNIISHFFLIYNMAAVIISIVMLFANYSLIEVRNGATVLGGFLWSRLWGIYTDPNHGAVASIVCILLSMYFIKIKYSVWKKAIYIINIILSIIYIACSDSRTGLVTVAVGLAVYIYLLLIKKEIKKINTRVIKNIFCIFVAIAVSVSAVFVISITKVAITKAKIIYSQGSNSVAEEELIIGRENSKYNADISDDISNRRFSIWSSGLEIFAKSPLFGASFRGMVSFAEKLLPNTYILNNGQGIFNCMHNSFLDVLVSQGIIGFGVFMAFAIIIFWSFCKKIFEMKQENDFSFVSVIFSIFATLVFSSLFISQIIYINSIGGILFWILLGYLMNYINQSSEPEER